MRIEKEVIKRIKPYMKSKCFQLSGRNYFRITNDIAFCISLDAPGGILYVTAYIIPLYIPCDSKYYTYGNRLNACKDAGLPPLQRGVSMEELDSWCDSLIQCISDKILPFFDSINDPYRLVAYVEKKEYLSARTFHCPEVFAERLRAYTFFYLCDFSQADIALKLYRRRLEDSVFLTESVRKKYLDEVILIESLLQCGKDEVLKFCYQTIESSLKIL